MIYKFRKGADDGLWYSLLLPFSLLPHAVNSKQGTYAYFLAVCLLLSVANFVKQNVCPGKSYTSYTSQILCIIVSIPVSLLFGWHFSYNIPILYLFCIGIFLFNNHLISSFLMNCPGSFTLGEVQIITHSIIMFLLCCMLPLLEKYSAFSYSPSRIKYMESINFMQMLLLGCLVLVYALYFYPPVRRGIKFYFTCFGTAFLMFFLWSSCYSENIILWLILFCFHNYKRVYILSLWITATFVTILYVIWFQQKKFKASTRTRKYFHIIVNIVYIPGILFDVELLNLASGIVLTLFILLEVFRILNIPIIGPMIGDAFQIFLDEKDSGVLILTHIYLLIGCSCPVWLYIPRLQEQEFHICMLSGIISVGFGDTAAALYGSSFGRHYWTGTNKTKEGSFCAFFSQLICCLVFLYIGHTFSVKNILLITAAALLTSFIEAQTMQVDNLVLPLFTFSLLSWID